MQNQVVRIPVAKIRESLVTLRTEYEQESLKELSESFEEQGQLQMVVVQMTEDGFYELIIGSRRLRAARFKGYVDILALVIDKKTPAEMLIMALAENLHRTDLNPFEEAQGFLRLMKEYGLSYSVIASKINKPEQYIRGRVQLLSMPEKVIGMVSGGTLPLYHIRSLARLPDGDSQVRLAEVAVKNHLNQTELGAMVQRELKEPTRRKNVGNVLTPLKVIARINQFSDFLRRVPEIMPMDSMNAAERQELIRTIRRLESECEAVKTTILARTASATRGKILPMGDPLNHGQEWTTRDIRRITDPNRPSDRDLSRELGRSVAAIRSMRATVAVAG